MRIPLSNCSGKMAQGNDRLFLIDLPDAEHYPPPCPEKCANLEQQELPAVRICRCVSLTSVAIFRRSKSEARCVRRRYDRSKTRCCRFSLLAPVRKLSRLQDQSTRSTIRHQPQFMPPMRCPICVTMVLLEEPLRDIFNESRMLFSNRQFGLMSFFVFDRGSRSLYLTFLSPFLRGLRCIYSKSYT
jgi:hypothetical protein